MVSWPRVQESGGRDSLNLLWLIEPFAQIEIKELCVVFLFIYYYYYYFINDFEMKRWIYQVIWWLNGHSLTPLSTIGVLRFYATVIGPIHLQLEPIQLVMWWGRTRFIWLRRWSGLILRQWQRSLTQCHIHLLIGHIEQESPLKIISKFCFLCSFYRSSLELQLFWSLIVVSVSVSSKIITCMLVPA